MENQNPLPSTTTQATPVIPDPIGNPSPSKKLPIKIVIGIIIFLLVAGGAAAGYVYKYQTRELVPKTTHTPITTITPTPSGVANWTKYHDSFYGFDISYPYDWKITQPNYTNSDPTAPILSIYKNGQQGPKIDFFKSTNNFDPNKYCKKPQGFSDARNITLEDGSETSLTICPSSSVATFFAQDFWLVAYGVNDENINTFAEIHHSLKLADLNKLVEYVLPTGWSVDNNYNTSIQIGLKSKNANYDDIRILKEGAEIVISRTEKFKKFPEGYSGNPIYNKETNYWTYFECSGEYGVCGDFYFREESNFIWSIIFSCAPQESCKTKAGIEKTSYAKERDQFLVSFKVKEK